MPGPDARLACQAVPRARAALLRHGALLLAGCLAAACGLLNPKTDDLPQDGELVSPAGEGPVEPGPAPTTSPGASSGGVMNGQGPSSGPPGDSEAPRTGDAGTEPPSDAGADGY